MIQSWDIIPFRYDRFVCHAGIVLLCDAQECYRMEDAEFFDELFKGNTMTVSIEESLKERLEIYRKG